MISWFCNMDRISKFEEISTNRSFTVNAVKIHRHTRKSSDVATPGLIRINDSPSHLWFDRRGQTNGQWRWSLVVNNGLNAVNYTKMLNHHHPFKRGFSKTVPSLATHQGFELRTSTGPNALGMILTKRLVSRRDLINMHVMHIKDSICER